MTNLEKRAFVYGFIKNADPMFRQELGKAIKQPMPPVNPATPALSKSMPSPLPTAAAQHAASGAPGAGNQAIVGQVLQKFFRNRAGAGVGQPFNPAMQPSMAGKIAPSLEEQQTIDSTERGAGGDAIPNSGAVP